jgi:hypothetical protein
MTFKEEIELQLKDNKILTFDILNLLKDKFYFSGRPKQVGDTVLFGMLERLDEEDNSELNLITIHEDEIGVLYEENHKFYKGPKNGKLPILKRIDDGQ